MSETSHSPAVIVDLDGSLVDMQPARHFVRGKPRNYDAFHLYGVTEALPNLEILQRIRDHSQAGRHLLFVSGRKAKWLTGTQDWMSRHDVPVGLMFFRDNKDNRPDHLLKEEIYRTKIEPYYQVFEAIDDRPSIIAMWNRIGVQVHVVPGWED